MRALPTSCEESERWFACRKCAMRPLSVSACLPPVYSIDASTKCIAGVIMMYMAVVGMGHGQRAGLECSAGYNPDAFIPCADVSRRIPPSGGDVVDNVVILRG